MLAISIKTFFRERSLFATIESIKNYCDAPYRIYIADDGPISETKRKLYDELIAQDHKIITPEYNTGASWGRVKILEALQNERYVLRLDDDFCFENNTHIRKMIDVLGTDPGLGALSNMEIDTRHNVLWWLASRGTRVITNQGYFEFDKGVLRKHKVLLKFQEKENAGGLDYCYFDFGRNFILCKRELFDHVCWDPELKIFFEHVDFLLQIYYSPFKYAMATNSFHSHREDLNETASEEYVEIRRRDLAGREQAQQYLCAKWNVKGIQTDWMPWHHRYLSKLAY